MIIFEKLCEINMCNISKSLVGSFSHHQHTSSFWVQIANQLVYLARIRQSNWFLVVLARGVQWFSCILKLAFTLFFFWLVRSNLRLSIWLILIVIIYILIPSITLYWHVYFYLLPQSHQLHDVQSNVRSLLNLIRSDDLWLMPEQDFNLIHDKIPLFIVMKLCEANSLLNYHTL